MNGEAAHYAVRSRPSVPRLSSPRANEETGPRASPLSKSLSSAALAVNYSFRAFEGKGLGKTLFLSVIGCWQSCRWPMGAPILLYVIQYCHSVLLSQLCAQKRLCESMALNPHYLFQYFQF